MGIDDLDVFFADDVLNINEPSWESSDGICLQAHAACFLEWKGSIDAADAYRMPVLLKTFGQGQRIVYDAAVVRLVD